MPLFAAVVLMAHVTGRADTWTALSAQIFLAARVLYVPAYVSGIPWLRTGLWWASGLSIVIILTRLTAQGITALKERRRSWRSKPRRHLYDSLAQGRTVSVL